MNNHGNVGPTSSDWHMARDGDTFGPYGWDDLVAWAHDGRLSPEDLLWHSRFPNWTPAQEVPGLFPAPSDTGAPPATAGATPAAASGVAAGATPGRGGRLSALALTAICLGTIIVLGGAGVGTWLAVRDGGDDRGRNAGSSDVTLADGADFPHTETHELTVAGRVELPEGLDLSVEDLSVLSNSAKTACSTDGGFTLSALCDDARHAPVFVNNSEGEPVLMALVDSSVSDLRPSVASTARSLVLYDLAFLSLPEAAYRRVAEMLESHPDLPALETAIANVLRSDPISPLDRDDHPEILEAAARISAQLFSEVILLDESIETAGLNDTRVPLLLASTGDFSPSPLVAAQNDVEFVGVADDPGHKTPEVALINKTWVFYNVTWELDAPNDQTATQSTLLERNELWKVWNGPLSWSPHRYEVRKPVQAGNGDLFFVFTRKDFYSRVDLGAQIFSMIMGAGGDAFCKLFEKVDTMRDLELMKDLGQGGDGLINYMKALGETSAKMQGMSFKEACGEVAEFMVVDSAKLFVAMLPLFAKMGEEEFMKTAAKMVGSKTFFWLSLGYGSVELVATFQDLGNPSFARYTTGGVQAANYYPIDARLQLTAEAGEQPGTWAFTAEALGMPQGFQSPLSLGVDFGDGKNATVEFTVDADGSAETYFEHTYDGEVPTLVWAVLKASTNPPCYLSEAEVALAGAPAVDAHPLRLEIRPSVEANTYVFTALVSSLPADTTFPLQLVFLFGDGYIDEAELNQAPGQVEVKHEYGGKVPDKATVALGTYAEPPSVLYSAEARLPAPTPRSGPQILNGGWRGTLYYADGRKYADVGLWIDIDLSWSGAFSIDGLEIPCTATGSGNTLVLVQSTGGENHSYSLTATLTGDGRLTGTFTRLGTAYALEATRAPDTK